MSEHYSVGGDNELQYGSHLCVLLDEGRFVLRSYIKLDGKLLLLKYWYPASLSTQENPTKVLNLTNKPEPP